MGILQITTDTTGQINVNPRRVKIITTDNLSTVTTAGYLNTPALEGYTILPTDIIDMWYGASSLTSPGTYEIFTVSISNGTITLVQWANPGDVLLPVVSNDFANFNGTTGQIKDSGYSPSNAAKTKVVMANGTVIANHIATYTDTAGTIGEDAATAINGGNIQAGLSGTAGSLKSFPSAATSGSLALTAVASSGDYAAVISNASLGQATTWTLSDPAGATSKIVQAPSALVSGNLVKASGTVGLVVDAGFAVHAATTSAYAGGGTSNTFTTTNMTSSSIVTAVILTSTNSVSITKAVPGTNTLAVTFSADPGANTTVSWISVTPAA